MAGLLGSQCQYHHTQSHLKGLNNVYKVWSMHWGEC